MNDATLAPDLEAPSPSLPAVSPHRALDSALVEKARDYARRARSENTGRAYGSDWRARRWVPLRASRRFIRFPAD
jgi:hypothetical protein